MSAGDAPPLPLPLVALGWDDARAASFAPWAATAGLQPGRVLLEYNHIYRVAIEGGEIEAGTSGRVRHQAASRSELPAVGDWVVVRHRPGDDRGVMVAVLPRRTAFSRRAAGQVTHEQVVAANLDVVFVVMALDADFNLRRLDRYLLLTRDSGAAPVVLLTKPDLADDPAARLADVIAQAGGAPVHVVAPRSGEGMDAVRSYLSPGRTAALVGSSGVGKTTIGNQLLGGELRRTREVRASDSRGRHTTMHRELLVLPGGALLVDTPGMRELQLWDVDRAVQETFDDIEALAGGCRFTDCRHEDEPRCAVKAAVEGGTLEAARLSSYLLLRTELDTLARDRDERAMLEEKRRSKATGRTRRPPPRRPRS